LIGNPAKFTWKDLLMDMSKTLSKGGYSQVPQMSSSKPIDLSAPVVIKPPSARRTKAVFIGINYRGSGAGELLGCQNDAKSMQQWAIAQGFSASDMKVLMDDGKSTAPTKANIWAALKWLVAGAQPGDALLFHFSGHGGQVKDVSGDEESGFDQTMIPVDHKKAGIILDDDILDKILKPLPAGVDMFCITDCCHSGTIMDLPYTVVIDGKTGSALNKGQISQLGKNQKFHNKAAKRFQMPDKMPDMPDAPDGQKAGGAAIAAGCGLCCADACDLAGDSDAPGGNTAPGAKTGAALIAGGLCACCVDICDLAGDSKKPDPKV
jgi:hypothetical protein